MASRDRTDVPELIGRAREKKVLGEALLQARRGEGRAVFLVGEGGIGKSRLVLEATALARDADMLVLLGRASRTGPSSAMRPLAEALASLFRDGSGPSRAEIGPYHAALGGLVLEYGPGGAAGDTTAASRTAVGDATDAPGPDGTGGRHGRTVAADRVASPAPSPLMLAEAILRLTAAAGAGRGCLLVLEDLHDADEQTLAVVEYLADNIAGQGSVLLATVRHDPGTAGDLAHALARRGNAVLLRPKRFSRGEVALLAGSGLGVSPASLPTEAVSRLWRDSAGNPLVADELLHAMASAGMLVVDPQGCRFDTEAGLELPFAVGHRITQHVRQLGAEMDRMLRTAAVIGERFPVSVLQRVLGTSQRKLLDHLRAALAAEVLQGCGPTADWYGFRDPITRTALLSQFAPTHRTALARRAADAVEQLHPGLPDIWCEFTAGLRSAADDPVSAAVLCGRAGRRALAAGLAGSAAELLERAWVLSDGAGEPGLRADLLDGLLTAFAETGRAGQGLEFIDLPQTFHAGATEPGRLAGLHIRLARLAAAAGRRAEGRRQVQLAQAALGTGATDRDSAVLDTVAAWVLSDSPREAELRAARAVATTERAGLPDARCRALTARGALAMRHGSAEASHWLTRARTAALAHSLPLRRLEATYLLAEDEWLARGDRAALLNARGEADRLGAGFIAHIAGSRLALDHALRGEYAAADRLAGDCAAEAERLGLRDSARYLLTVRAVCAGHQGRRAELDLIGAELRRCPGDPAPTRSLALGLAGVVCALLEEDRDRAARVMAEATRHDHDSPAPHPLVGQYGLFRLVTAVRGGPAPLPGPQPAPAPLSDPGLTPAALSGPKPPPPALPDPGLTPAPLPGPQPAPAALPDHGLTPAPLPGPQPAPAALPDHGLTPAPLSAPQPAPPADLVAGGAPALSHLPAGAPRLRWNASFDALARAVALGRQGRGEQAAEAVAEAGRIAEPYPLALHLGLRLVAEAAHSDHWGDPEGWLRRAEEFFRLGGVPATAGACRVLLRRRGAVVPHRRNVAHIPRPLRVLGVTEREFEVLQLLTDRPDNRSIAAQLFISPRTVEKHVASLIAKTGQSDRTALRAYVVEGGAAD